MQLLLEGWLFHYNYMKPQDSTERYTPALKAGAAFPYRDWRSFFESLRHQPK
jgi:hypothetical protein